MLHEGTIGRRIKRDSPGACCGGCGVLPGLARGLCGEFAQARRQAVGFLGRAQEEAPFLRRVEHVVREAGRDLGEFRLDAVEALLALALEADAREFGIAHQRLHDALLGRVERREARAVAQCFEGEVERTALAHPHGEGDDFALHLVVCAPQVVGVPHPHEMTDRAPDPRQPVADTFDRVDRARPVGCGRGLDALEFSREFGEQRAHRRHDVLRPDAVEGGWGARCEQRIRSGVGCGACAFGVHANVLARAGERATPAAMAATTLDATAECLFQSGRDRRPLGRLRDGG